MAKSSKVAPMIKGFLPVRLMIPLKWEETTTTKAEEETYFFVKEHQSSESKSKSTKAGCTLFVANTPVVPGISAEMLLKSIFGRFGNISRVTVVESPRNRPSSSGDSIDDSAPIASSWSTHIADPSYLPHVYSVGSFAHVVFQSTKDMRRSLRALQDVISNPSSGIELETIEIQTLSDESLRRRNEHLKRNRRRDNESDSDDHSVDESYLKEESNGLLGVVESFRSSCKASSRELLLEECNSVMQAYEDAEADKKRARDAAQSQPDEDGFITVTSASVAVRDFDLEAAGSSGGRKRNKRSRKKKLATGANELQDFYRFQRRETRKRSLEVLRKQFEDDLNKVKKMKNERHYRPF